MKFVNIVKVSFIILKNFFWGGNIISLSLMKSPRDMAKYIAENLFLYKTLNSKRGIPQRNVYQVLQSRNVENIKLGNLRPSTDTFFLSTASYISDLVNLCLICQITKPKVVFEIGTLRGYTTLHLALNTPDDALVYTLDLPKDEECKPILKTTLVDGYNTQSYLKSKEYIYSDSDVAPKITNLFGDSGTFDFTPYYKKIDFFFIDGAHSYEYVKSDTINALKCTRPGSVIAWHDFGRVGVNGVSKWILELSKSYNIYAIPGASLAYMIVDSYYNS